MGGGQDGCGMVAMRATRVMIGMKMRCVEQWEDTIKMECHIDIYISYLDKYKKQ